MALNAYIRGTKFADLLEGSGLRDKISGKGGADVINGGAGNDKIKGGNDVITGGAGNDDIDGGKGIDTAIYQGLFQDYVLSFSNMNNLKGTVAGKSGTGDGVDTLKNVEFLQFKNAIYDVANDVVYMLNQPPALTVAAQASYTENDDPLPISPNLSLSDADSQTLAGATVKITEGFIPCDLLLAKTVGNIQMNLDDETGVLTLSGVDSVANYQKVLASVSFEHAPDEEYGGGEMGDNPTNFGHNPTRTIAWQVDDGSGLSKAVTTTVIIHAVNDAPVLAVAAQASYTENDDPQPISPNLSLTDADSQTMAGARVQITSLPAGIVNPCELQFTPIGNITGSYDQLTHVLTLTGVDSVANYQAALASVSFDIASDNPTYFDKHLTHTIAWQVDDGAGFDNLSNVATTTIAIHAINDAPLIGGVTAPSDYTENGAPVFLAANLALMDPDSQTLAGATVKITDGLMPCDELKAPTIDDIRVSYDDETGVLTLSGVARVASYQKVLAALTFEHAPDDEYGGGDNPTNFGQNPTRTITLQVDDGAGFDNLSNVATTTIAIHAINDAPLAHDDGYAVSAGKTLHADAAKGVLSNDSDADSLQLTAILKDGPAHGQLVLNPDGSFDYLADQSFTGTDSFSYLANDGEDNSNIANAFVEVKAIPPTPQDFLIM